MYTTSIDEFGFEEVSVPPWWDVVADGQVNQNESKCGWIPIVCTIEMGEEVMLIYWPPELLSRSGQSSLSAQKTFVTSAITFNGQDLYLRSQKIDNQTFQIMDKTTVPSSVLPGPFTFVSPNVYLAHHPINIINTELYHETDTREIRTAGIITLQSSDVYSYRPKGSQSRQTINYPALIAKGQYLGSGEERTDERVPFDFKNLANPVPASVYYDARRDDCWGQQTHCATITDDSYRPRIVIHRRVWSSLFPAEYEYCGAPLLVDPPLGLVVTPKVQLPTITAKATSHGHTSGVSDTTMTAKPGDSIGRGYGVDIKPTAGPGWPDMSKPGDFPSSKTAQSVVQNSGLPQTTSHPSWFDPHRGEPFGSIKPHPIRENGQGRQGKPEESNQLGASVSQIFRNPIPGKVTESDSSLGSKQSPTRTSMTVYSGMAVGLCLPSHLAAFGSLLVVVWCY
jgi:hypothetical protein